MQNLCVKIKKTDKRARIPVYGTENSAGLDVFALLDMPQEIKPGERVKIGTGIAMEIPDEYEVQMRPRSGLALKNGITLLNAPGTIDADYRGELAVILINLGNKTEIINDGDKIAQIIFAPVIKVSFEETDQLAETKRADGGFGSTGR